MELLFEHTRSTEDAVTSNFLQLLRHAWTVFHHQPYRHHLYGIMFRMPHHAYICYTDHSCAVYSEPLDFLNIQHARFLKDFLSGFIADPQCRGRYPSVKKVGQYIHIHHAEKWWKELPDGLLCYRPSLIGRNIRVSYVERKVARNEVERLVMKSTCEEEVPPSSPPPEVEVYQYSS